MMPLSRTLRTWAVVAAVTTPGIAIAQDEAQQRQFFEAKIRPLLVDKCQSCHEGDEPESKLRVDSLDGLLTGGIRGPAIIPGKPAESLLISAVKHGEVLKMPAKEKLPAAQIADLVKWVETGAYWPDAGPVPVQPAKPLFAEPEFPPEQRAYWAFQKPQRPKIPEAVRPGEFGSPIDRFVDAKLTEAGYAPAAPAAKRALLRRATFDLTGVPPTPDEWEDFLADSAPDAWSRLIDRLLASPRYGEKWGRHWLDVARYGDSNGLDENLAFANAFRYRDYVVTAWNRDTPYDAFVRAQIAGDLSNAADGNEALEHIVATGFLAVGAKMLAEDDPVKMQMDIIDEQVDTLGRAFLGMTFGCARCHHHKFDPISAHDYYGLAGIFKSTKTMENFGVVARWQERPLATPELLKLSTEQKTLIVAKQSQIQQRITLATDEILADARRHLGDYLLAAAQQDRLDQLLAARQPLGNQANAAKIPGVILLEAENFARGNVAKDTTTYGQEIGVLVNQGQQPNFAEYDLEIPQAGTYQLELRYAAADARPCRLLANAKSLKIDAAAKVTGGWHPKDQRWHTEGVFELPAGKVVLRLEQPKFFPHIDKLLLAPATELPTSEAFVRLDAAYQPVPSLVAQWRKFLNDPASQKVEVLAGWREFHSPYRETPSEETLAKLKTAAAKYQQQAEQTLAAKPADDLLGRLLIDPQGPFAVPKDLETAFPSDAVAELNVLRAEKNQLEAAMPKFPEAMAVSELVPEDLKIHFRGSHLTLGEVVPRRFPKLLEGGAASVGSQGSGRLALAQWLTQPDHPLTARVIVNRLWGWHFGEGIVRSVDNFGLLGERPTHPELLDWLAVELPRRDWSLKSMHREVMQSAAYQRSGQADDAQRQSDPDNRFLGRFSRRRLHVEELRDAILFTAGTTDERLGGSLLPTPNRQYVTSTANVNPDVYRSNRRSIYLPVVRSALYDVFQAFDFADPNVSSGQRQSTTVAAQALFLMNSEFVSQQSKSWADALLTDAALDDASRIKAAYRRALNREAAFGEIRRAEHYLADFTAEAAGTSTAEEVRRNAWQSFCRALVSTNEFVFVE